MWPFIDRMLCFFPANLLSVYFYDIFLMTFHNQNSFKEESNSLLGRHFILIKKCIEEQDSLSIVNGSWEVFELNFLNVTCFFIQ